MTEKMKSGDQVEQDFEGRKQQVPDSITEEVQEGSEKQTQAVTDYYSARKQGLRDKHTGEHLGFPPTFYDSSDNGELVIGDDPKAPPVKPDSFYPQNGVYNPAAPPGVGDSEPGKPHENEYDAGPGNYAIDYRNCETWHDVGAFEATRTYRYEGELETGGLSLTPWDFGDQDTKFTGSEQWTRDGRLLQRHVEYESGVDMKFKTPDGEKEVSNVSKVDTIYNLETGNYDTTIVTEDGLRYRAETAADGSVKSFEETTLGPTQTDSPGMTTTNAHNFKSFRGTFSPVRPPGIDGMDPGEAASDEKNGIDWRETREEQNPDGSKTFHYEGEVADILDTGYEASETVNKDGTIAEIHVEYERPVDQKFFKPDGGEVSIPDVTRIDTRRVTESGAYETEITCKDGSIWRITTYSDGRIADVNKPKKVPPGTGWSE